MVQKSSTKKYAGFSDFIKDKIIEMGTDYFKRNTQNIKNQISKHIEKIIEKKIKRELKKIFFNTLIGIILIIAMFFILYGIISMVTYLLVLPSFATPLLFGTFLLIIAMIIYLLK